MRVWLILCSLLFATDAAAHRFAPSLLEVTQLSATTFNATWKTPLQKVSATPIEPRFPAACEITSASPWVQEGTGELKQIQLQAVEECTASRSLLRMAIRQRGICH